MRHPTRPLPLALSLLLAACATAPVPKAHPPGIEPPTATVADIATGKPTQPHAPASADVWERLRGSFAMPDCAADPAIDTWARRYTQAPKRFEAQLRTVLPRLVYVQEIAARHNVPGEFALLPWVESHYQPIAPHKNRPAGMWQIVPSTARHMGLRIERGYDGRLDVPAATDAVMALLGHYHDWFQDWRLADYAYNAGRFGIDRMLAREGAPPAEPAVPTLPVRAGTRAHLVKLLAIACVVREPERFHVTLPTLDSDQQLVAVQLSERLPLAKAARLAGLPLAAVTGLNAGYRDGTVTPQRGGLLLPRRDAEKLRAALLAQAADGHGPLVASLDGAAALPTVDDADAPATQRSEHVPGTPAPVAADAPPRVHVVKPGDTLFDIARTYAIDVAQIKRWNRLHGSALRIGQKLLLRAPD